MGAEALLISLVVYTYEGIGFLKLANIVLILINPSPCYVKNWILEKNIHFLLQFKSIHLVAKRK